MELIHPLPALSSQGPLESGPESSEETMVTVLAHHTIAEDQRPIFLDALKQLLAGFDRVPGAKGCKVFLEEDGELVHITILQRFASSKHHEAWLNSEAFSGWKIASAPVQEFREHVRSYSGIEALFAAGQSPDAPPRWKMAIVLLIAVFPLSLALSYWFGKALASMAPWLGALITSPIMVVLMTYVLVPFLTKVFGKWLQPAHQG